MKLMFVDNFFLGDSVTLTLTTMTIDFKKIGFNVYLCTLLYKANFKFKVIHNAYYYYYHLYINI